VHLILIVFNCYSAIRLLSRKCVIKLSVSVSVINTGQKDQEDDVVICRVTCFQLRQLRPITRAMHVDSTVTVVTTRLDYCNTVLYSISNSLLYCVICSLSRTRHSQFKGQR